MRNQEQNLLLKALNFSNIGTGSRYHSILKTQIYYIGTTLYSIPCPSKLISDLVNLHFSLTQILYTTAAIYFPRTYPLSPPFPTSASLDKKKNIVHRPLVQLQPFIVYMQEINCHFLYTE